ncbi:MAG TPA: nuclear transport factor 2 family protein [Acidimicrobiales bacterium]|nr:nuclear transport factor 2 family protein [Acidimicrobiales bacterium]
MGIDEPSTPEDLDVIRDIERRRLRSLVDADVETADALHASDFQLVNPLGRAASKEEYLGGIASGVLVYRRFEADSDIEVMVDGNLAVLRYRSAMEVEFEGRIGRPGHCWHTDCYRRDGPGADWQVVWSQATGIADPPPS